MLRKKSGPNLNPCQASTVGESWVYTVYYTFCSRRKRMIKTGHYILPTFISLSVQQLNQRVFVLVTGSGGTNIHILFLKDEFDEWINLDDKNALLKKIRYHNRIR